ncbi:GGDEF domain-containing protein [Bradyrhizobium sp. SRL28]|uniref:GGDEF domain-containing protein n=1 Tax=Bradyrhizobium sp. SRL28 TaxID=2836178 RepID=UPI001BDF6B96|nr:GGDEF domain-containing protein [Bradyrhizobium sp. SRL28]MBT1514831.1 GGDEF domain-containing protein [Bradyrhizobium sp. SRL28]
MLDIGTAYIVTAYALLGLALLQISALATRLLSSSWLGWWAASNLLLGIGTLLVGLQTHIPTWLSIHSANALTLFGYLTLLASIRSFAGKPVRWQWMALVGTALSAALVVAFPEPNQFAARIALLCLVFACCDGLIIREGRDLWRREQLTSAKLLAVLFAISSALLMLRSGLAATGNIGSRLLAAGSDVSHWLVMFGVIFVTLRGIVLLFMLAERNQNALQMLAWSDPLTGALNRAGLANAFAATVRTMRRTPEAVLSLILIDLDHFKAINDTRGHAAGDAVLKGLVEAMRTCLPEATIGRCGGDEFAVLLKSSTPAQLRSCTQHLRETFAAHARRHPLTSGISATLSIGIARCSVQSAKLDHLVAAADKALYESKSRGRDCVSFASLEIAA